MANMNSTPKLRKGVTLFDVLDGVEAAVIDYMSKKRGMSEERFRKFMSTDPDTAASYTRKIDRALTSTGLSRNKLVG